MDDKKAMATLREQIYEGIDLVDRLPTIPESASRLLMALADDEASNAKICSLLMRDPAMSANVLRLANSAYYSAGAKPIASLETAVARIGLKETRNVVTAAGVIQAFSEFATRVDARQFWKHSVSVALATEALRMRGSDRRLHSPAVGQALYLGGLLHDVGILLLGKVFPTLFDRLKDIAAARRAPLFTLEAQLLETSHTEIGARLAEQWNMPDAIVEAVRYHHFPDGAPDATRPFAQVVHLADYICAREGIGDCGIHDEPTFFERCWYDLGLADADMPALVESVKSGSDRGAAIAGA